jgi:hypothetical protein
LIDTRRVDYRQKTDFIFRQFMTPSSHWKSNKRLVWGQPDRSKSVLLRTGIEYVNLCVINLFDQYLPQEAA